MELNFTLNIQAQGYGCTNSPSFFLPAGQSSGTLTIMVIPSPGKFPPNSEESNKFNHQNFDPGNVPVR